MITSAHCPCSSQFVNASATPDFTKDKICDSNRRRDTVTSCNRISGFEKLILAARPPCDCTPSRASSFVLTSQANPVMDRRSSMTSSDVASSYGTLSGHDQEDRLEFEDFVAWAEKCQLNYTRTEMKRIFETFDLAKDKVLHLSEFHVGALTSPFFRALIKALSTLENDSFRLNPSYDYTQSTESNYAVPLSEGFVGAFKHIRETMDYTFHQNYSHERQLWQDTLIRRCVLDGGYARRKQPFLLHTCGPMGAGKGYVLGWLSSQSILPSEYLAKIDPDHFKQSMPEWEGYVSRERATAGTLTHKESGYIAEVAQELAMLHGFSLCVDGSMRDVDWYASRFAYIRENFPEYKIGVLIVTASDERVQDRLAHRSLLTGRSVPDHIAEASRKGLPQLMLKVKPFADYVACIDNDDEVPALL